jgi:hypothetical protein
VLCRRVRLIGLRASANLGLVGLGGAIRGQDELRSSEERRSTDERFVSAAPSCTDLLLGDVLPRPSSGAGERDLCASRPGAWAVAIVARTFGNGTVV